jgi:toxin ParE1/3/4
MYRLIWSPEALDDLGELRDWIASDNPKAAGDMFLRIVAEVAMLARHPEMGHPGRVPGTRELVISRTPFIVAYGVIGRDTVRVLAVRHAARRWPASFDR